MRTPRLDLALPAALVAALVACSAALVARSGEGWFVDDDLTNMRWVVESRDRPWRALTELTAVHDHIRPFNLLAHWAGAVWSDGDWWGPHAVLLGLIVAGFAGVIGLAWSRHGSAAAVVAGGLALGAGGIGDLASWNAWIGSAGEIACGLWAVVAADRALASRSRGWTALSAALLVSAGLFKEPGWVVYPLAIAAMALPRGSSRWPLAAPLIGAVGFAVTFHPANTARYLEVGGPIGQRVAENLAWYGASLVGARWEGAERFGLASLPLFVALWTGLLGRSGRAGLVAVALGVVSGAVAASESGAAAWLILGLPLAVLARRWREPPPELVVAALGLLVMVPNLGPAHAYALTTAYGLSVFAAGELVALWRETEIPDAARAALFGTLAVQGAALAAVAVAEPIPARLDADVRDRWLATAALVRTLEPHRSEYPPPRAAESDDVERFHVALVEMSPYLGTAAPLAGRETLVRSGTSGTWWIGPTALGVLFQRNLAPHFGSRDAASREVWPPPGWWAAGLLVRGDGASLTVRDRCEHRWVALPDPSLQPGYVALEPLRVTAACSPLTLAVAGAPWYDAQLLLVPLDEPRPTLGGAAGVEVAIFGDARATPEDLGEPGAYEREERPRPKRQR